MRLFAGGTPGSEAGTSRTGRIAIRAGPQASQLRVSAIIPIEILEFDFCDCSQAGRLRSRSYGQCHDAEQLLDLFKNDFKKFELPDLQAGFLHGRGINFILRFSNLLAVEFDAALRYEPPRLGF